MNILYFRWNSCNESLTISHIERLGHKVFEYSKKLLGYEVDSDAMKDILFSIHREKIDCLFTINYLPVLASIGEVAKVPYISWTQDAPAYPLYSPTRNLSCNYQFIFDKEEFARLEALDSTRIFHSTLCSDPEGFSSLIKEKGPIASQVCFLGNLYNKTDFERISSKDEYLKGYVDGLLNIQKGLYGCNVIESSLTDDMAREILAACSDNVPEGYSIAAPYAAAYILERKVTGMERLEYLSAIGERFPLTIYTSSPNTGCIKADFRGYADYNTMMPRIFNGAKINLHFAPRNIHSAVSLRVFDVLASRGFLLTTWAPEIAELFEDERELVLFSEKEEMLDKIDYYLRNDSEREKIAENGYQKILKEYTYEKLLRGLFDTVFKS